MSRPPIPDHVLRDVLRRIDQTQNVGAISQVLISMMRADPLVTFDRVETQLRALGSRTHLVALPESTRPVELDARHPVTEAFTDTYLWVCLHGKEEAEGLMRRHDVEGATANLTALATCGVLTLRQAEA